MVPFGQVLISADDARPTVGVEICETWVPVSLATELAARGRPSWRTCRRPLITVDAARTANSWCARCPRAARRPGIYTAAGLGEFSTDLAWDGETMIYEANAWRLASASRRAHYHNRRRGLERLVHRAQAPEFVHGQRAALLRGQRAHGPRRRSSSRSTRAAYRASSAPSTASPSSPNGDRPPGAGLLGPTTFRWRASCSACVRSATERSSSASRAA